MMEAPEQLYPMNEFTREIFDNILVVKEPPGDGQPRNVYSYNQFFLVTIDGKSFSSDFIYGFFDYEDGGKGLKWVTDKRVALFYDFTYFGGDEPMVFANKYSRMFTKNGFADTLHKDQGCYNQRRILTAWHELNKRTTGWRFEPIIRVSQQEEWSPDDEWLKQPWMEGSPGTIIDMTKAPV